MAGKSSWPLSRFSFNSKRAVGRDRRFVRLRVFLACAHQAPPSADCDIVLACSCCVSLCLSASLTSLACSFSALWIGLAGFTALALPLKVLGELPADLKCRDSLRAAARQSSSVFNAAEVAFLARALTCSLLPLAAEHVRLPLFLQLLPDQSSCKCGVKLSLKCVCPKTWV